MAAKPEVVVITGASAGIGRAAAIAFAKQGAYIGLLARGIDGLEGAKKDVEAAGGKALVIPTDVAEPEQVEKAAIAVEEAFGPIDIWVNNAMASILSPFMEMNLDDFRRSTEVTYFGYVYGTMTPLRRMKPRDKGTISRLVPPLLIAQSRFSRSTVGLNLRYAALQTLCAANSSTTAVTYI